MLIQQAINPLEIRKRFPILREDAAGNRTIYLDSAASSQKPEVVLSAMDAYYRRDYANVHRGVYALAERSTDAYDRARGQVARFFGVDDEGQIIFVRNTTEGINLVAQSWSQANLAPGDAVVLSIMEHHSNLVPWQLATERTGARLEFIGMHENGVLNLDDLDRHLAAGDVKLVACNHASNMLGTINPIEDIVERAHAYGAIVLVDGAQGAPHLPVDLSKLDLDFYVCSSHKMCGPMGSGMLFGRRNLLEAMPPYMGGGDMIRSVELRRSTWADLPSKFEAGTPSVADAVGFGVACEFLTGIGADPIQEHERNLTRYALNQLLQFPNVTVYGPDLDERVGVISFNLGDIHAHDVATILDESNIAVRAGHHCTQPLHQAFGIDASVRASFYIYNTFDDIDQLINGLRRVITVFSV